MSVHGAIAEIPFLLNNKIVCNVHRGMENLPFSSRNATTSPSSKSVSTTK